MNSPPLTPTQIMLAFLATLVDSFRKRRIAQQSPTIDPHTITMRVRQVWKLRVSIYNELASVMITHRKTDQTELCVMCSIPDALEYIEKFAFV